MTDFLSKIFKKIQTKFGKSEYDYVRTLQKNHTIFLHFKKKLLYLWYNNFISYTKKMTEEKLQGAIDLINDITGSTYQLEKDSRSYSLILDNIQIADGNLEDLYQLLVADGKSLLN